MLRSAARESLGRIFGELRAGNAGANTAADQIAVAEQAIEQIPVEHIEGIDLLLRVDSAGASHELLDWCRDGHIRFSVAYDLTETVREAIVQIPDGDPAASRSPHAHITPLRARSGFSWRSRASRAIGQHDLRCFTLPKPSGGGRTLVKDLVKAAPRRVGTLLSAVPVVARYAKAHGRQRVNSGRYWDYYVKKWELQGGGDSYRYLGCEWKNEERFLELLESHAAPDKTALEIGCGGGRITARAVELFGHVHAADPSAEMLKKSRAGVTADNVSFSQLDGFTLAGFPDASVDFVFSHDVFVHFSSLQVYPYLIEMTRVLKPGGVGLISFNEPADEFDTFKELSLDLWRSRRYPPHMRVHFLAEGLLRKMLDDLELELVNIDRQAFMVVSFRKPLSDKAG